MAEARSEKSDGDLLAISPLPSPSSRHGSIFAAANELGVPSEFSDILAMIRPGTAQNMADEADEVRVSSA